MISQRAAVDTISSSPMQRLARKLLPLTLTLSFLLASCACNSPFIKCSGHCINPTSDSQNCGTCGNACASGRSCNDAMCIMSQ